MTCIIVVNRYVLSCSRSPRDPPPRTANSKFQPDRSPASVGAADCAMETNKQISVWASAWM